MLDTGDNQPKGMAVLQTAKKVLIQHRRCKTLRAIFDESNRTFSFYMESYDGQTFYLVARSTEPMRRGNRRIVSSQTRFIKRIAPEHKPLIMFIPNEFRIFDPEMLLMVNYGENVRADSVNIAFLNWDLSLSILWDRYDLRELWDYVQVRTWKRKAEDISQW